MAIATLSITGCTTTSTGQKVVDPAVLSTIAQEAAAVGVPLALQQYPQYRPQFELARKSLRALVAAGSGSPADLQKALAGLPVAQLRGQTGAIAVSSAVTIIDAAGKHLATMDKAQVWSNYVQPVATGLLAGLEQALGPEAAP